MTSGFPFRSSLWAIACLMVLPAVGHGGDFEDLLQSYRQQGVQSFDPEAGAALWRTDYNGKRCVSCHTESPRQPGRHDQTGKPIEPMAPSVNPDRLTEMREMKKWLLRNCKSTLGRECTAQEKGDVLTWLRAQ